MRMHTGTEKGMPEDTKAICNKLTPNFKHA
jgi:hypothetical protein